ncbi:MAG TPA: FAD-dependent oxidoreductase, partial [Planctomycetaceae bacterium]|nr:FAD-dependent oxidoreductase [Planctomycetaceae bacterium]
MADEREWDVVVYGGTSAGIAAAVQVRRMGGDVIVIEPSNRIGGLTTGGLGQTDIGNKAAIGGIAREFYQRVRKYYDDPKHWKWQRPETYRGGGQSPTGANEETMWTFEPSAALSIMQDLVREYEIPVVYNQRLNRTAAANARVLPPGVRRLGVAEGVLKREGKIVSITMESGQTYRGRVFLDATYEGDLLAAASVSYTVGRESNSQYQETLNGVQTKQAKYHQFMPGVDPYVKPGDPASGLLPGIDPNGPGQEGSGDARVQAFCFRLCLTDHPENRIPFSRPDDYDPLRYELLLRNFEAGERGMPWINSGMPNRKTDTNNRTGFSTDFIGQNYEYPEAGYELREKIVEQHRSYQQGLMWTLANHPRVPDPIRNEVARWGTCRDEFEREDGWQEQLYIREARRMMGAYVMTQHNCQGRTIAEQPVGLAAYTMDSHNVQRYVDANGHVRNEGDVEVGGFSPYPIDYRSLLPKAEECENLLVPVCLSASHISFGSIRMEPVFMVLGQSAATAAMHSIEAEVPVQNVDYARLRERLLADKQVLIWTGPVRQSAQAIDVKTLQGIVIDDEASKRTGFESISQVVGPFVGAGYRHDENRKKGEQSARFRLTIPRAGRYEVRIAWTPNTNRATNVPVTVQHQNGSTTVKINQREKPNHGAFGAVGTFDFMAGETTVDISNADTDG